MRRDSSSGPISEMVVRIGMALLAEQVPEDRRRRLEAVVVEADLLGALDQEIRRLARLRDAGQVALDVGGEDRHAASEKPSAMICSVTVLPVPVAPVTRPWRLAIGRIQHLLAGAAGANQDAVVGHWQGPRSRSWPGSFPLPGSYELCPGNLL